MWKACFSFGRQRIKHERHALDRRKEACVPEEQVGEAEATSAADRSIVRLPTQDSPEVCHPQGLETAGDIQQQDALRDALVLAATPACFTIVSIHDRRTLHQNFTSKRWMGDRVKRCKSFRIAQQPSIDHFTTSSRARSALRSRMPTAVDNERPGDFEDAPVQERNPSFASKGTNVSDVSESDTEDVLALIFVHEPEALARMLQELVNEGDVWKGVVRVPAFIYPGDGSSIPRDRASPGSEPPIMEAPLEPPVVPPTLPSPQRPLTPSPVLSPAPAVSPAGASRGAVEGAGGASSQLSRVRKLFQRMSRGSGLIAWEQAAGREGSGWWGSSSQRDGFMLRERNGVQGRRSSQALAAGGEEECETVDPELVHGRRRSGPQPTHGSITSTHRSSQLLPLPLTDMLIMEDGPSLHAASQPASSNHRKLPYLASALSSHCRTPDGSFGAVGGTMAQTGSFSRATTNGVGSTRTTFQQLCAQPPSQASPSPLAATGDAGSRYLSEVGSGSGGVASLPRRGSAGRLGSESSSAVLRRGSGGDGAGAARSGHCSSLPEVFSGGRLRESNPLSTSTLTLGLTRRACLSTAPSTTTTSAHVDYSSGVGDMVGCELAVLEEVVQGRLTVATTPSAAAAEDKARQRRERLRRAASCVQRQRFDAGRPQDGVGSEIRAAHSRRGSVHTLVSYEPGAQPEGVRCRSSVGVRSLVVGGETSVAYGGSTAARLLTFAAYLKTAPLAAQMLAGVASPGLSGAGGAAPGAVAAAGASAEAAAAAAPFTQASTGSHAVAHAADGESNSGGGGGVPGGTARTASVPLLKAPFGTSPPARAHAMPYTHRVSVAAQWPRSAAGRFLALSTSPASSEGVGRMGSLSPVQSGCNAIATAGRSGAGGGGGGGAGGGGTPAGVEGLVEVRGGSVRPREDGSVRRCEEDSSLGSFLLLPGSSAGQTLQTCSSVAQQPCGSVTNTLRLEPWFRPAGHPDLQRGASTSTGAQSSITFSTTANANALSIAAAAVPIGAGASVVVGGPPACSPDATNAAAGTRISCAAVWMSATASLRPDSDPQPSSTLFSSSYAQTHTGPVSVGGASSLQPSAYQVPLAAGAAGSRPGYPSSSQVQHSLPHQHQQQQQSCSRHMQPQLLRNSSPCGVGGGGCVGGGVGSGAAVSGGGGGGIPSRLWVSAAAAPGASAAGAVPGAVSPLARAVSPLASVAAAVPDPASAAAPEPPQSSCSQQPHAPRGAGGRAEITPQQVAREVGRVGGTPNTASAAGGSNDAAAAAAGTAAGAGAPEDGLAGMQVGVQRTADGVIGMLRQALASQSQAGRRRSSKDECWHEVWATRAVDPVTRQDVVVLVQHDVTAKAIAERHLALVMETEHRLLEQLFPRHILQYITEDFVARAAAGGTAAADAQWRPVVRDSKALATFHPQVTLLFADIKGFTPMCKEVEPRAVMSMLNDLYSRYDKMLDEYGVFKVETIGDCYFVAGGLVHEDEDGMAAVRGAGPSDLLHAERVFAFAKAMLEAAQQVPLPTTGQPVQIRVGLHSGPVVSGVVGTRMPRFCLFGDTVNTASRMESTGVPGAIHASEATLQLLRGAAGWNPTGGIEVKGKGLMRTYLYEPGRTQTVSATPTPTPTPTHTHTPINNDMTAATDAATTSSTTRITDFIASVSTSAAAAAAACHPGGLCGVCPVVTAAASCAGFGSTLAAPIDSANANTASCGASDPSALAIHDSQPSGLGLSLSISSGNTQHPGHAPHSSSSTHHSPHHHHAASRHHLEAGATTVMTLSAIKVDRQGEEAPSGSERNTPGDPFVSCLDLLTGASAIGSGATGTSGGSGAPCGVSANPPGEGISVERGGMAAVGCGGASGGCGNTRATVRSGGRAQDEHWLQNLFDSDLEEGARLFGTTAAAGVGGGVRPSFEGFPAALESGTDRTSTPPVTTRIAAVRALKAAAVARVGGGASGGEGGSIGRGDGGSIGVLYETAMTLIGEAGR